MKKITPEELKRADGRDGRPVHVCVGGKVYDLTESPLWSGGDHMNRHNAGEDLSESIKDAPHDPSVLEYYDQIGVLDTVSGESGDNKVTSESGATAGVDTGGKPTTNGDAREQPEQPPRSKAPRTPAILKPLLRLHPHPVSVHFPIALTIVAALLVIAGRIFPSMAADLHTAARIDLVLAALFTLPAIGTGFFSHYYDYGNSWTSTFKIKLILSAIFLPILMITLIVLFIGGDGATMAPWLKVFFTTLVCLLAVNVMALGYFGGRITFPGGRRKSGV